MSSPPPPLQGMTLKEINAILTETLACFLPGRAKDLSAPPRKTSERLFFQLHLFCPVQMKQNATTYFKSSVYSSV